ncbi:hypothetical protein MAR_012682 [Mya arenaria]|uniref:Peptidase A2 domain-containing protein n=1 Tax=Mya arenaria TaxID=6604 RepID=A0ABY7G1G6_MYAAR|nr:hypothetical protein MAR_012682 [Mya arenaria]
MKLTRAMKMMCLPVKSQYRAINSKNGWYENIKLEDDATVLFKLDTGAEENVILQSLFYKLPGLKLRKTNITLRTFSNQSITPLGTTTIKRELNNGEVQSFDFYVVNFKATPTLGINACKKLNLIRKIDAVKENSSPTSESVIRDYGHIFTGLGKFVGKYHIEIDKTVPPVINAPRNVPFTLMPRLKETLDTLEEKGD